MNEAAGKDAPSARALSFICLSLAFLVLSSPVWAWRQYRQYPLGADAMGIGFASVADAASETAMELNPAGLVQLQNTFSFYYEASGFVKIPDILAVTPQVAFDTIPFVAFHIPFDDFRLGVSMQTLDHSVYIENSYTVRAFKVSAAFPLFHGFSVGLGAGPVLAQEGDAHGWGGSGQLGVLWRLSDDLKLGFSVFSPVPIYWEENVQGLELYECTPWSMEAGLAFRMNPGFSWYASLEWMGIDQIDYVIAGSNQKPSFSDSVLLRLHPHLGIRFLEPLTGGHFSFGFAVDNAYHAQGAEPQYLLTAGVRAYGKNSVFRAALSDGFLLGMLIPSNVREAAMTLSLSVFAAPEPSPGRDVGIGME